MKTAIILAASLLAFAAPASAISPDLKCHPKVCSNHGSIPVELGKGSCKAHPGSCK